jgi:hypothetical protein
MKTVKLPPNPCFKNPVPQIAGFGLKAAKRKTHSPSAVIVTTFPKENAK